MRKVSWIACMAAVAGLSGLIGCAGDDGAQGPAGPAGTASCLAACHTDNFEMQDYILGVETEFAESKHNTGDTYVRRGSTNSTSCSGCHTTEGFQYRIANNGDTIALTESSRIGCFACHAPHTNENFDLRVQGPTDLILGGMGAYDRGNSNTCGMCHQAQQPSPAIESVAPITSPYWGPHHGPQANILVGIGAYEFSGTTYGSTHSHKTIESGCVNCHMAALATDGLAGGHSFKMEFEYHGSDHINDNGCVSCHSGQDMTDRVESAQSTFDTAFEQLGADLVSLGWLNADLAHVDPAGIPANADARGAVFNYLLLLEDSSRGVHNPVYINNVLAATASFVSGEL